MDSSVPTPSSQAVLNQVIMKLLWHNCCNCGPLNKIEQLVCLCVCVCICVCVRVHVRVCMHVYMLFRAQANSDFYCTNIP